ncbi:phosphoglycerate mutase family protein [Microdochium trichocladiopsis]|uniref:Phosphoglycerate mutase family protein n=1 Tax=Microdochium trichocladiopsis TaxID=1682393 RepID=A0A9P9BKA6_9PEZI|nr:phosphoglycerate mutase family protein [Microdochium trichocladiopsis]KAH7021014.1 phosphoglycerate mutase family protein [Microdochium trichocladiopsis]
MLSKSGLVVLSLASACMAWPWGRAGKWSDRQRTTCHGHEALLNYTTVTGFFLQDDPSTNPSGFDYTTTNYGLINQSYPTDAEFDPTGARTLWERFEYYVNSLNQAADKNTQYKVLLFGRHGEGYHNAAESAFGTPAWNCYWGPLDGNGTVTWRDAALTQAGIDQTTKAFDFWTRQLSDAVKMPAPQSYYSSPLRRCWQTAQLSFAGLRLPADRPFVPVIKEFFREGISMRTCDERNNKTWIHEQVPNFLFEDGFTELDELWRGYEAETDEAQVKRTKAVLDDVFAHDDATWISITAHSGAISKHLQVLGHRAFRLGTGQAIPVLVKAQNLRKVDTPTSTIESWWSEPTCANGPPITSIGGTGCICSTGSATATFSASASAVATESSSVTVTDGSVITPAPTTSVV